MRRFSLLGVFALWLALAVAVQRWASIEDGIREGFGIDVSSYVRIAEAAPSFPDSPVRRSFAERFPAHWVAGVVSDITGISLENAYRAESVLTLAALLIVVYVTLVGLGLAARSFAIAFGALMASAYPLHQLLATPGMVADDVFLLGLGVTVLGLVRGHFALFIGGLVLATLGRQTAVPVAIAAGAWTAFKPAFPAIRWRAAVATALVPLAVYAALGAVASPWAAAREGSGIHDLTVIGFMTSAHAFGEHLGRTALGILVPATLIVAAWWRVRGPLPWALLLLAAAVVAQPLLLGPVPINPGNEPRLAALAAPALAIAAGVVLKRTRLAWTETLLLAGLIAFGGFHPRYTRAPWRSATWALLELLAALAVLAVVGRRAKHYDRAPPIA